MLSDLGHPEGHETYRAARSVGERDRERLKTQPSIQGGKKITKEIIIYVYSFCNSETKKHTNITLQYEPMALLNLSVQTWFNCDNT